IARAAEQRARTIRGLIALRTVTHVSHRSAGVPGCVEAVLVTETVARALFCRNANTRGAAPLFDDVERGVGKSRVRASRHLGHVVFATQVATALVAHVVEQDLLLLIQEE